MKLPLFLRIIDFGKLEDEVTFLTQMLGLEVSQIAGIALFTALFLGLLNYLPRLFTADLQGFRDFIVGSDDVPKGTS